jgi:hypothetical protein
MPEEDRDVDMDGRIIGAQRSADILEDQPSISGMDSFTSPSAGSGSGDGEDERSECGVEINRGRDRTIRGQKEVTDEKIQVKSETEDMET